MQEGILFHNLLDAEEDTYFRQSAYRIEGSLDVEAARKSFNGLSARHDVLRTVFNYSKGMKPLQIVLKQRDVDFYYEDLRTLSPAGKEQYIEEFKKSDAKKSFDITKDVLIRISIFRREENSYELIWSDHHISMDGWCRKILYTEFAQLYIGHLKGIPAAFQPVTPFSAYIKWIESRNKSASLAYWSGYLKGYDVPVEIPRLRIAEGTTYKSEVVSRPLTEEKTSALKALAKTFGTTLNVLFQVIWGSIIAKYHNRNDVVFGAVVSGRPPEIPGIESMVGLFINTIPVRVQFAHDQAFDDVLLQCHQHFTEAESHHYCQLADIQSASELKHKLFDHILIFENVPVSESDEAATDAGLGFQLSHHDAREHTNYDLDVTIGIGQQLTLQITYNEHVHDRCFVENLFEHFGNVADQVLANPRLGMSRLKLISPAEEAQVCFGFNKAEKRYDGDLTIIGRFEYQAEKNPGAPAVIHNGRQLTYGALNQQANCLANFLIGSGFRKGSFAGVCLDRGLDLVVAMLAIAKAGGVYVPFSTGHSVSRTHLMIEQSEVSVLFATARFVNENAEFLQKGSFPETIVHFADHGGWKAPDEVLAERTVSAAAIYASGNGNNPPAGLLQADNLYMIYTSGSTGTPKGALIRQDGALNHILAEFEFLRLNGALRILQSANISSDISVWQILAPLTCGGATVVIDHDDLLEYDKLCEVITGGKIDLMVLVPSFLVGFLEYLGSAAGPANRFPDLKYVLVGGEDVTVGLVNAWLRLFPHVPVVNAYGPAEASDDVLQNIATQPLPPGTRKFPIGKPLSNINVFIVDNAMNLQPVGACGEICVSGVAVGAGYWRDEERTRQAFVPNPFAGTLGDTIYKTGDIGRWLPDGNVEFFGRADRQVKIRGHRIELEEVDFALKSDAAVMDAVTDVRKNEQGNQVIAAYLIPRVKPGEAAREQAFIDAVRNNVKGRLPEYMRPAWYVVMDHFPVNRNHKVDRKALPDPVFGRIHGAAENLHPKTEVERELLKIWSSVLGVSHPGPTDNFFDLGGHSLKAVQLMMQIQKVFGHKISLKSIFSYSTLREQAAYIEKATVVKRSGPGNAEAYRLSPFQKRVWVIDAFPHSSTINNLFFAYRFSGLDPAVFKAAFHHFIRRHDVLRNTFLLVNGEPHQTTNETDAFGDDLLAGEVHDPRQLALPEMAAAELMRPFDLQKGPLFRAKLMNVGREEYLFVFCLHRIVSEGLSEPVIMKDLVRMYRNQLDAHAEGRQAASKKHKETLDDFYQRLHGGFFEKQKLFWRSKLDDDLPRLEVPHDLPRPADKSYRGGTDVMVLDEQLSDEIATLGHRFGITTGELLVSLCKVLLYRYTGQTDVVVGYLPWMEAPAGGSGRNPLASPLPLRTTFVAGDRFEGLLANVRAGVSDLKNNFLYPFELIIQDLQLTRDVSRAPLFDVVMAEKRELVFGPESEAYRRGVATRESVEIPFCSHDLIIHFGRNARAIVLEIAYSKDLFSPGWIQRFKAHFAQLASAVLRAPAQKLAELDYLTEAEKHAVVSSFNSGPDLYPAGSVLKLFEEQVRATPGAVAVQYGNQGLTFADLDKQGRRLANRMAAEYGIAKGDFVGILARHTDQMIVALVATLKLGAVYIPIDAESPDNRILAIVRDAAVKLLISDRLVSPEIGHAVAMLQLGGAMDEVPGTPDAPMPPEMLPDDVAYVLYTSGTTGRPKGVMVTHRGLSNYAQWLGEKFEIGPGDHTMLLSSFAFDLGYTSLWGSLLSGMTLHLADDLLIRTPERLIAYIAENKITFLKLTPSLFHVLCLGANFGTLQRSHLRFVLLGGESLHPADILKFKQVNDKVVFVNHYGPTEATIGCIVKVLDDAYLRNFDGNPVIGTPIRNAQCYVLDDQLNVLPAGIPGNLYVAGSGLARGYLNNPELTRTAFISPDFPGGRTLYKTGDKAKWLPTGEIVFLGRGDSQVKIRGYRVEPLEVQALLQKLPGVDKVAVVVQKNNQNQNVLAAYLATRRPNDIAYYRKYLGEHLPEFTIPAYFYEVEEFPLTRNGKVDLRTLTAASKPLASAQERVAPRTAIERELAAIWEEALERTAVGVYDNFFEIGGDSLVAAYIIAVIHKKLNVLVSLGILFRHPTIASLAQEIEQLKPDLYEEIRPVEEQEFYGLSHAQKRLWIVNHIGGSQKAYIMLWPYVLDTLDRNAFERALLALVRRHDILRTVFLTVDGEPRQKVLSPEAFAFRVEYVDLRGHAGQNERVQQYVNDELNLPFDFTRALLRCKLIQVDQQKFVLLFTMHHITSDGWSEYIIQDEILKLYHAFRNGGQDPLAPLRIQYKDYCAWQNVQLSGSRLKRHQSYWLKQFEEPVSRLKLPTDFPRPALQTFSGAIHFFRIDPELQQRLNGMARENGASLFMTLLSGVSVLLYKYTHQTDIVLGTAAAGRDHVDLGSQVGFYANILPIRLRFSDAGSFHQLLTDALDVTLEAFEHQLYPFDLLIDDLNLERDLSHSPLTDVMVVMQNIASGDEDAGNLGDVSPEALSDVEYAAAKYDLIFTFRETAGGIQAKVSYNTDLFKKDTIERLSEQLIILLNEIVKDPAAPVVALNYLSEKDSRDILFGYNHTAVPYPSSSSLPLLFEQTVNANPDAVALVSEHSTLTYRQLNERANAIANHARDVYRIGPNALVGLMIDEPELAIVCMLGIVKAGAAYVPIDPNYPAERKKFILDDTNLGVLITRAGHGRDLASFYTGALLEVDAERDDWVENGNKTNPPVVNGPHDLTYVIYTSGSTGQPKGVMVEHRSVIRLVRNTNYISVEPDDRILQASPLAFDASTFEIWGTLLNGASLYLTTKDTLLSAQRLGAFLKASEITKAFLTTALFNRLIDADEDIFAGLKVLLVGGEILSPSHIQKARKSASLSINNIYGPTENTTYSTYWEITTDYAHNIPIGRPIANSTAYILDAHLNPVGTGIPGELYVGGDGLARGYLNNAALTAERFIGNPFVPGDRLYKTGDVCRWLSDGAIAFLGRNDDLVKLRGYRIEPGEIENKLLEHPGVNEAIVVVNSDPAGDKYLAVYYTTQRDLPVHEVKHFLTTSLPAYMVPSYFVALQAMPLNANGKIDRTKLPAANVSGEDGGIASLATHNETEMQLVEIWKNILGKDQIGVHANFFERGGHSLKAVQLITQVHKLLDVKIELKDIFLAPTVALLAGVIAGKARQAYQELDAIEEQQHYRVSHAQKRLWVLSQFRRADSSYNVSSAYELEGLDLRAFEKAFETIVQRHEILRTTFIVADGEPKQKVHDLATIACKPEQVDLTGLVHPAEVAREMADNESSTPFDLERGPLIRCKLLKLGDRSHMLLLTMHHIITDGDSAGVFIKEFLALYYAFKNGTVPRLPPLNIQHKDYSARQNGQVKQGKLDEHRAYWREKFRDHAANSGIPVDYERPKLRSVQGSRVGTTLPAEQAAGLRSIGEQSGTTLFTTFLSVVNVLLYKYTDRSDITIGTPVSNRELKSLENQIGFYVNLLPLKNEVRGDLTFTAFLQTVKNNCIEAFSHQAYPFDLLVEDVVKLRDPSRHPLFDVLINVRLFERPASPDGPHSFDQDLIIRNVDADKGEESKLDLRIVLQDLGDEMQIEIYYNTDLFKKERINVLLGKLEKLITEIVSGPNRKIDDLTVNPPHESTRKAKKFKADFTF